MGPGSTNVASVTRHLKTVEIPRIIRINYLQILLLDLNTVLRCLRDLKHVDNEALLILSRLLTDTLMLLTAGAYISRFVVKLALRVAGDVSWHRRRELVVRL